jgi:hypothetical protein
MCQKKQNSLNDISYINDFSQKNKQNSVNHKSDNFLIEKNMLEKRNESKEIQGNI